MHRNFVKNLPIIFLSLKNIISEYLQKEVLRIMDYLPKLIPYNIQDI